jgi:hypothetical protein
MVDHDEHVERIDFVSPGAFAHDLQDDFTRSARLNVPPVDFLARTGDPLVPSVERIGRSHHH